MTEPQLTIAGIGLAGSFGLGKPALLDALRRGGKPNGTMQVTGPSGERQLPVYQVDVAAVSRFVSAASLRRMNRFARIAVLGAASALEDAGWEIPAQRDDVGLVIASGYGASKSTFDFLDSMIAGESQFPSPTLFSNSVHSSAASHVSIVLGLRGPCLTVSQFEMSPISALLTARDWLLEERVEAVVFGAVDELCPVLGYCYECFFGADAKGPIEPFAWNRQTAVMGEGAAFLLLQRDGATRYGHIEQLAWTQSRCFRAPTDRTLVLGADGHTCSAGDYRRVARDAVSPVAYTPVYGSLPGGQAFDIAIAAVAAEQGLGPLRICSVKCDAEGNCGVVECHFGPEHR